MRHTGIAVLLLGLAGAAAVLALLATPSGRAQGTPSIDIISVGGDAVFDEATGNFSIPPTGEF